MSASAVVEEGEDVDTDVSVAVTDDSIDGRNNPFSIFCFSKLLMFSILQMQSCRPLSCLSSGSTPVATAAVAAIAALSAAAAALSAAAAALLAAAAVLSATTAGLTSIKMDADNGDTEEAEENDGFAEFAVKDADAEDATAKVNRIFTNGD